jgi:hypothetical protein
VEATWWAAIETHTHPRPGGDVHPETEAVMVEAALSVAAVQVLYEIFLAAYPREVEGDTTSSTFEVHSHSVEDGKVVSGLKLIRNGEMHSETIVAPNVERTLGVPFTDGTYGYRIVPHWAAYQELPDEFREARHAPKKGKPLGNLKTNQIHHDHYESEVSERLVVETLLDAFRFFARCDPRIVAINESGEARHFPLAQIVQADYERRHPDQEDRAVIEKELRRLCESQRPAGERRILIDSLQDEHGELVQYCGVTRDSNGGGHFFVEAPKQVLRDITEHNFPYFLQDDGVAHRVVPDESGGLAIDLATSEPSSVVGPDDRESWMVWHYMDAKDAFQYAKRRRSDLR